MFLNVLTLTLNPSSVLYFWIYVSTTPLLWLLYLLAARNVYQKVFSRYPGISAVGKWSLYAGGGAAVLAAVVSLLFPGTPITASRSLTIVTVTDQCLLCGLSLFLLIVLSVISRYPIAIQKNVAVHAVVLNAILFTQSLSLILDQATAFRYVARINTIGAAIAAICCFLWTWLLTPQGDDHIVRVRQLDPAVETRLLGQLDTLNGILLRAARK